MEQTGCIDGCSLKALQRFFHLCQDLFINLTLLTLVELLFIGRNQADNWMSYRDDCKK